MKNKISKLNVSWAVRFPAKTKQKFMQKSSIHGKPSQVLRQIVDAFNEDRLFIELPTKEKQLYGTRKQD